MLATPQQAHSHSPFVFLFMFLLCCICVCTLTNIYCSISCHAQPLVGTLNILVIIQKKKKKKRKKKIKRKKKKKKIRRKKKKIKKIKRKKKTPTHTSINKVIHACWLPLHNDVSDPTVHLFCYQPHNSLPHAHSQHFCV